MEVGRAAAARGEVATRLGLARHLAAAVAVPGDGPVLNRVLAAARARHPDPGPASPAATAGSRAAATAVFPAVATGGAGRVVRDPAGLASSSGTPRAISPSERRHQR